MKKSPLLENKGFNKLLATIVSKDWLLLTALVTVFLYFRKIQKLKLPLIHTGFLEKHFHGFTFQLFWISVKGLELANMHIEINFPVFNQLYMLHLIPLLEINNHDYKS